MQTFLPYESFSESARVLDTLRLGKQVIEARQIGKAIADPEYGWQNHPAVTMWRGYRGALIVYTYVCALEWKKRRGKVHGSFVNLLRLDVPGLTMNKIAKTMERDEFPRPEWIGNAKFHASHRSNLMRKKPEHYGQYFGNDYPMDLPYFWPSKED